MTTSDDLQAWNDSRLDADLELEAMHQAADQSHARREQGVCQHGSAVGYRSVPLYDAQKGLRPGQSRCTEGTNGCAQVFSSDEDWYDAMSEAGGF